MTSLDAVVLARASEQTALIDRAPSARRVYCACGCGVWTYQPARVGRPRLYVNEDHYRRERNRRWRERNARRTA